MPEGDTIFRLAERLRPLALGRAMTDVWLREVPGAKALEGAVVSGVRAVGKHLLIEVASEPPRVLRTHLGMNGSWQAPARPGTRRHPSLRVAFRAGPSGPELRCKDAAQVEVLLAQDLPRCAALARLGPDLMLPHDPDEVLGRARAAPAPSLAELLLDQRVAAGLGNVYKSELLFRASLHPFRPPRSVSDETMAALYADGASLLRANATRPRRVTTLGPRGAPARVRGLLHFVYDRAGHPCVLCRRPIEVSRQGEGARPTYWCATCQPVWDGNDPIGAASSEPGE